MRFSGVKRPTKRVFFEKFWNNFSGAFPELPGGLDDVFSCFSTWRSLDYPGMILDRFWKLHFFMKILKKTLNERSNPCTFTPSKSIELRFWLKIHGFFLHEGGRQNTARPNERLDFSDSTFWGPKIFKMSLKVKLVSTQTWCPAKLWRRCIPKIRLDVFYRLINSDFDLFFKIP